MLLAGFGQCSWRAPRFLSKGLSAEDEISVNRRRQVWRQSQEYSMCRFTHLERGSAGLGWSQEFQQELDRILLFGLNYVNTVDCPLVQLEKKCQQKDQHQTTCLRLTSNKIVWVAHAAAVAIS